MLKAASTLKQLVGAIDKFEEECEEVEYTDTEEVWCLLYRIRKQLFEAAAEVERANTALVALVEADIDRTCPHCDKDGWGAELHGDGCPVRLANIALGDL